jgi:hypothetical protein
MTFDTYHFQSNSDDKVKEPQDKTKKGEPSKSILLFPFQHG